MKLAIQETKHKLTYTSEPKNLAVVKIYDI